MLICHCFRITRAEMVRLIEERDLRSVEDVSEATGACRGCRTCEPDITALLRACGREVAAPPSPVGLLRANDEERPVDLP